MLGRMAAWVAPLAAAMAMGGCGTMEIGGPIDSRAAYPDFGTGNVTHSGLGFLNVRPVEASLDGGQGLSNSVPPGFRVYDDLGLLVRRSASGEITLPEGRYLVQLERPGQGPPTFWVRVEQSKLTVVDLNRGTEPPTPTPPVQ